MNVSASKIWNKLNHIHIVSSLKKKLLDLAATKYDVVNLQNNVKNEKRHAMYKQKNNDKKTIIIYPIIMNCSIIMYNSKFLY